MNDDTLADLKQFIAATVSQESSGIREEIKNSEEKLDKKLSKKIDDLSDSVAEAMSSNNDAVDSSLKDHEARITQLENLPA